MDPYQKLYPGEFAPRPGATQMNAMIDAAKSIRGQIPNYGGDANRNRVLDPCIAWIQNNTSGDLAAFSVVGLTAPPILPADSLDGFQDSVQFGARTPVVPGDDLRFGILIEPVPAGAIGRAVVAGVSMCQVNVTDTTHNYAIPINGNAARLQSGTSGPAKILWADTGTAAQVTGATPVNGGTGYAVNDTLPIAGGTYSTQAVLKVTSVSSGVITGVSIQTAGAYSALPSNPVSQASTSGSGSGATFTLTWSAGVVWALVRLSEYLSGGSANYVARWLDTSTLGTGKITDDNTTVTMIGQLALPFGNTVAPYIGATNDINMSGRICAVAPGGTVSGIGSGALDGRLAIVFCNGAVTFQHNGSGTGANNISMPADVTVPAVINSLGVAAFLYETTTGVARWLPLFFWPSPSSWTTVADGTYGG